MRYAWSLPKKGQFVAIRRCVHSLQGASAQVKQATSTKLPGQNPQDQAPGAGEAGKITVERPTAASLDAEEVAKMKAAMADRDGGGSAGIEYEDGKPVSMKRSVRANMFRYI